MQCNFLLHSTLQINNQNDLPARKGMRHSSGENRTNKSVFSYDGRYEQLEGMKDHLKDNQSRNEENPHL